MILLIINIVFALVSIACCIWAPTEYSRSFCVLMLGLYMVQNGCWLALQKRSNRFGFELIFMLSYLFCNFIYPVFYIPDHQTWSFFLYPFSHLVISQATAVAYMAYTFYMLGITDRPWESRTEPDSATFTFGLSHYRVLTLFTLLCFALFVATGGYSALWSVYNGSGVGLRDVGIYSYFLNLFSIGILLMAAFVFRLPRPQRVSYLMAVVLMTMIMLSTGSRQLAISIVLILCVSYSMYIYRLKGLTTGVLLLAGALVLNGVMLLRRGDSNEHLLFGTVQYGIPVLNTFEDLIVNNLNLYVLVNWGHHHDLTWLHGMLLDISSPIPGLANKLIAYFQEPAEWLHGGDLPSYLLLGRNAGWGTGTNMAGEAFRSFGGIGMCVAMFVVGCFIRNAYYQSARSYYWYAIYMLFVGHALIYPRAPYLFDPRTLVWSIGLLFAITLLLKYVARNRKEVAA